MSSTRPPSSADLFADGDKIRDLFEVVGMVVTNFGGVEETLRYLDWQLRAFPLAATMPSTTLQEGVKIALAGPRSNEGGACPLSSGPQIWTSSKPLRSVRGQSPPGIGATSMIA
jgi:hypothetical protein